MAEIETIRETINDCIGKLYDIDKDLFKKNEGRGVCERCLVFRFAHYLQEEFNGYFVDCDYNSSFARGQSRNGKPIINEDGSETKRFVDIIIHKRSAEESDYICFEIKKWNNRSEYAVQKDENNLKHLTSSYGYKYGFHVTFGKTKEQVIIKEFLRENLSRVSGRQHF